MYVSSLLIVNPHIALLFLQTPVALGVKMSPDVNLENVKFVSFSERQ